MKKKAAIKVYGTVQGVFFRASTRDKAKELNISGFVENLDNGAVYIEAEGEEAQLNEFIEWCKLGPVSATVEDVEIEHRELSGFGTFQIRY